MKKYEMEIEIDALTGEVSGDVITGPGGAGCVSMLDEVLGDFVKTQSKKKPEYYKQATNQNVQNIKR